MKRLFGEYIKRLRESHNLSQRELSSLLELNTGYICKLERGKLGCYPSINTIKKLAFLFDVNESKLMRMAGRVPPGWADTILGDPLVYQVIAAIPRLTVRQRDGIQKILDEVK